MSGVKTIENADRENKETRLRKLEAVVVLLGLDDLNKAYETGMLISRLLEGNGTRYVHLITKCDGPKSINGKCSEENCNGCN